VTVARQGNINDVGFMMEQKEKKNEAVKCIAVGGCDNEGTNVYHSRLLGDIRLCDNHKDHLSVIIDAAASDREHFEHMQRKNSMNKNPLTAHWPTLEELLNRAWRANVCVEFIPFELAEEIVIKKFENDDRKMLKFRIDLSTIRKTNFNLRIFILHNLLNEIGAAE
jgi:hypothetical protein